MNVFWFVVAGLLAKYQVLSEPVPRINVENLPQFVREQAPGSLQKILVELYDGGSWFDYPLPLYVLKGSSPGPRLALTAAIHGDEVTGVPVVVSFLQSINPQTLMGDILAAPLLNPIGFFRFTRGGYTGKDINRSFLLKSIVGEEQFYAEKIFATMKELEVSHHVDLHTATTGNNNSFYVRADLLSDVIDDMARFVRPEIILNTTYPKNSLRSAMASIDVHSITVEMGGPNKVADRYLTEGVDSLIRLVNKLGMIATAPNEADSPEAIVCSSSTWVCSTHSGLVYRRAGILSKVKQGESIAEIRDVFGNFVANMTAPHDGVVIGNTERLSVVYGARLVHIGKITA